MTAQARDLIMWVGSGPYPTWRAFADEARAMGVCKRVRAVPRGIVVGQSKCYLAHGERVVAQVESTAHGFQKIGLTCRYCGIGFESNSQNPAPCRVHMLRRAGKPRRALYGYFRMDYVMVVGIDDEAKAKLNRAYPGMTFQFRSEAEAGQVQERGCGSLKKEAIYICGPLTEYPEPKPWSEDTFVGFRYHTEGP